MRDKTKLLVETLKLALEMLKFKNCLDCGCTGVMTITENGIEPCQWCCEIGKIEQIIKDNE